MSEDVVAREEFDEIARSRRELTARAQRFSFEDAKKGGRKSEKLRTTSFWCDPFSQKQLTEKSEVVGRWWAVHVSHFFNTL